MSDVQIERQERERNHRLSLLDEIYIEQGETADWNLLHELHYKAENLPAGPRYFRARIASETIGVGVMSNPKMLSRGRNSLMPKMKPNQGGIDGPIINRHRAVWLNKEICCNSRLVLDTMFRGAGIAYRMQNLMMRMSGTMIVEFQSSMSKFNPFAERAGIRFGKLERSQNYDKGLTWFRRWFDCVPTDEEGIIAELKEMKTAVKEKCVKEMRKLYFQVSVLEKSGDNRTNGTSRVDKMDDVYLLKSLQQVIFATPLFGIYKNPDYKILLPKRIPILAFDNQRVDEPLRLDLL